MFRAIGIRILVYGLIVSPLLLYTMQPLIGVHQKKDQPPSDTSRLRSTVKTLVDFGPRDSKHPDVLKQAADWLAQELALPGAHVRRQPYQVKNETFENIRANFGPDKGSRIIIGAHFDAYQGLPGADDNASGVAVLLELARLLSAQPPSVPVELVAWNLEEPPFFRTEDMGSRIHARSLKEDGVPVSFVVSLESLGTYSEAPKSQSYPLPGMDLLYPDRGNFLAVVSNYGSGWLVRKSKERMQEATSLPIWSINAPAWLVGIDFSDHASYWKEGYPAFMLTGTAFYRNKRYHTPQDTPDQLDYEQMARVVQAVHALIPRE